MRSDELLRLAGGQNTRIIGILGAPGAGKTRLLQDALARAEGNGTIPVYVDLRQAREILELDAFYAWMSHVIRNGLPGLTVPRKVPRQVQWCDWLQAIVTKTTGRLFLAFDQVEALPDWCAHSLVSDLREIQDRSSIIGGWSRFACIVSGTVSLVHLRRRANSPNLQFDFRILPDWELSTAADSATAFLEAQGIRPDPEAIAVLADASGGEFVFLNLLKHYLPRAAVDGRMALAAIDQIVARADELPALAGVIRLYVIDPEFKRRADDLLAGRPALWCDPSNDIDVYQLAGALVLGDAAKHEVRFRNGLVRRTIERISHAQSPTSPSGTMPIHTLKERCLAAVETSELLENLGALWTECTGTAGTAALLIGAGRARYRCIGSSVVRLRRSRNCGCLEMQTGRLSLRSCRMVSTYETEVTGNAAGKVIGVGIETSNEFVPTVSMRDRLRPWMLIVESLLPTISRVATEAVARAALSDQLPDRRLRVFVSSTSADLKEHRRAAMEQIVKRDMLFRGMEHFGADPGNRPPPQRIRDEVRQADIYVGIFGIRYGSVDQQTGLSMTETELIEAETQRLPLLLYVLRDDGFVRKQDQDGNPARRRQLDQLVARLQREYVAYQFFDSADLAKQLYEDLGKLDAEASDRTL